MEQVNLTWRATVPSLAVMDDQQAFFYTHTGGPWHALLLPGTHFLSFMSPVGTHGIIVIIVVFIESNAISDRIFSIFVLFSFLPSVFL